MGQLLLGQWNTASSLTLQPACDKGVFSAHIWFVQVEWALSKRRAQVNIINGVGYKLRFADDVLMMGKTMLLPQFPFTSPVCSQYSNCKIHTICAETPCSNNDCQSASQFILSKAFDKFKLAIHHGLLAAKNSSPTKLLQPNVPQTASHSETRVVLLAGCFPNTVQCVGKSYMQTLDITPAHRNWFKI